VPPLKLRPAGLKPLSTAGWIPTGIEVPPWLMACDNDEGPKPLVSSLVIAGHDTAPKGAQQAVLWSRMILSEAGVPLFRMMRLPD
jgi:hypothetical protein